MSIALSKISADYGWALMNREGSVSYNSINTNLPLHLITSILAYSNWSHYLRFFLTHSTNYRNSLSTYILANGIWNSSPVKAGTFLTACVICPSITIIDFSPSSYTVIKYGCIIAVLLLSNIYWTNFTAYYLLFVLDVKHASAPIDGFTTIYLLVLSVYYMCSLAYFRLSAYLVGTMGIFCFYSYNKYDF